MLIQASLGTCDIDTDLTGALIILKQTSHYLVVIHTKHGQVTPPTTPALSNLMLTSLPVDSTGTFKFSHFTSDVTINSYPVTCYIQLSNYETSGNDLFSPDFVLTDIAGVSVNTFSTDPPTASQTPSIVTTTAPGTTVISTATPTPSLTGGAGSNPTSALTFTPLTSTTLGTSTINDIAATGKTGTGSVAAASSLSSSGSSSGLSTGAKAGIGIGCALLALVVAGGLFYLVRMKRKLKKAENRASMYPPAGNGGFTYQGAASTRAESPPPMSTAGQSWAPVPQSAPEESFSDKHSVSATTTSMGYTPTAKYPQAQSPPTPTMGYSAGPGYDGPIELGADQSYAPRQGHHEVP